MIEMDGVEFLTAQEACQLLDIKAATLYAYVSRGLLRSYRQGIKRARLYPRSDVEDLTRLRGPAGLESGSRPGSASPPPHASKGAGSKWIRYV
jgi:excisionase family DNA binding protein